MASLLPVLLAIAATVLLWWASTGLILILDRQERRGRAMAIAGASLVAAAGLGAIVWSAGRVDVAGAYAGFVGALAIWGWHELLFLSGLVTGPRRTHCPPEARGWRRFSLATRAVITHEIALAVTALGLWASVWGGANVIGALTFSLLFGMRLSTKLNLFFGAPHVTVEYLPAHLQYLASYFGPRRASWSFAVSLPLALGAVAWAAAAALSPAQGEGGVVGFTLLAALAALGLLEHLFLLAPLGDATLWRWAMPAPAGNASYGLTSANPSRSLPAEPTTCVERTRRTP